VIKQFNANKARLRRHRRVRKRLSGTPDRPRLSVFRSSAHIYAQIVDDQTGQTLVAASSREELPAEGTLPPLEITEPGIKGIEGNRKVVLARLTGRRLAERARARGISQVVFDRGGYLYHGRVAALAVGAREGGLDF